MKPEFHKNMHIDDYHTHDSISRSRLATLKKSPLHYWWEYISGEAEKAETTALRIGKAFHIMVLEPELFADEVVLLPDRKRPTKAQIGAKKPSDATIESIEFWERWDAENEDKIAIKQDEYESLLGMARGLRSHPAAESILGGKGIVESSIFWDDMETGLRIKARPDYLKDDFSLIVDVKTVHDASVDHFQKAVFEYDYDLQAHMLMESVAALTGKYPEGVVFACVEKKPPYAAAFYLANEVVLRSGETKYNYWMAKLKSCVDADVWPSYSDKIEQIGLPAWADKKLEMMEQGL